MRAALLGIVILVALPESPEWLASRAKGRKPGPPLRELFQPALFRTTLAAIAVSAIPMT